MQINQLKYSDEQTTFDQQQCKAVPLSMKTNFFGQVKIRHQRSIKNDSELPKNICKKTKFKVQLTKMKIKPREEQSSHNTISNLESSRRTVYLNGNKILGTWKNNSLHGFTTIQYKSGEYFEGYFEQGQQVSGIIRFKDNTEYRGGFKDNMFHGNGTLTDANNRKITCLWENNKPASKVKIEYKTGDIYYGEVDKMKKHGQGQLYFRNGSKYIGSFNNGGITGYGYYYENDELVANGIWLNGTLQVQEKIRTIIYQIFKNVEGFNIGIWLEDKNYMEIYQEKGLCLMRQELIQMR